MRVLRLPVLILLPLLVVAALVVQGRDDTTTTSATRLASLTPTAAAPGTLSSTWYCAAGSATGVRSGEGAGPAEQVVIVANASDAEVVGRLTAMPDQGEPASVEVRVPAHGSTRVRVSDVVAASWAAALVETSGAEVTVSHQLRGPAGRSTGPCASSPSAEWYFPAGTTRAGATNLVALFNPFPGEATVDLSFDTDEGARTPGDLQGLVVPGGRVTVVDVSAVVTLREHVATTVSARSGRIVAEQIQIGDGRDGSEEGLTAVVGATAPASTWVFPVATPAGSLAREVVSLFNPGDTDAQVTVQVPLDDPDVSGTVEPFEVTVPAHRYVAVDLYADSRVPRDVGHWVVVEAADGAEVVAERSIGGAVADESGGFVHTMGLPVVSTRWLAPLPVSADLRSSQLAVVNPSASATATVSVRAVADGSVTDVPGAVDLQLGPGERVLVDLAAPGLPTDGTIEVVADSPVAVAQWVAYDEPEDVAAPVAVPVAGDQSLPVDVVEPGVAPLELDPGAAPDDTAFEAEPDAGADTTVAADDGSTSTSSTSSSTTTAAPG